MNNGKNKEKADSIFILPMLPLEDIVLTPLIPQPVKIEDENQKNFLDKFSKENSTVFIATPKIETNERGKKELLPVGLICIVDRILQMPGAPSLAFIRPLHRARLISEVYNENFLMAKVKSLKDFHDPKTITSEMNLLLQRVEDLSAEIFSFMGEPEKSGAEKLLEEHSANLVVRLYTLSHVAPLTREEHYDILESSSFKSLLDKVVTFLDNSLQRIHIQASIHEKTHKELSQQQKEVFLRTQLKHLMAELGENEDDDIKELIILANNKNWDAETRAHFDKELQKLKRLNVNNPEYSVQYSYLESFLNLPWKKYKHSEIDIDKVEEILNRDHYGLEKVKQRILEYMAVLKLRNDLKAPILCLYGPPGVGKTSIGKSVAEAIGREYNRISLGGLHDEAEIRGHRRTYIGAMPGRFLHSLSKLEYGNPLMLLDEIDKVGKDFRGDPSSALLEALDPEQNNTFHDNFIDFPYDLSRILFIATANDLNSIPPPLRDRMEVIEMKAYSPLEKREIALRHLINKALGENGFEPESLSFSPEAIDLIIKSYTKEPGVRQLKMQISRIIRKLAFLKVKNREIPDVISPELVTELLDKEDIQYNKLGFK